MMWVAVLIPGAELTAADLVNALLYWRSVMAVLLGAQALPQIFGKSGSPAASTSKSG